MGHLKDCNQRYGSDIVRTLKLRLVGGKQNNKDFGRHLIWTNLFARYGWDSSARKKTCRPPATYDTYNANIYDISNYSRSMVRRWRMTGTDLYEHWLADPKEIERMIAYVNRCPVVDGRRIALLMLDIDCHHGQEPDDAEKTSDLVSNLLDMPLYWEVSTSGSGLHGYGLFGWKTDTSYLSIIHDINLLQTRISDLSVSLAAPCHEIKGAPVLLDGRRIVGGSSWAKVPRPQTRDQAEALLKTLTEVEMMEDALLAAEQAGFKSSATAGLLLNGIGSTPAPEIRKRGAKRTEITSVPTSYDDLLDIEDTFHRCCDFVYRARPTNPTWSADEAWEAYRAKGFDIGNSDERCFKAAWKCSEKSWDGDYKGKPGLEQLALDNVAVIEKIIAENGKLACLKSDHAMRQRGRKYRVPQLSAELLAQVFTLVSNSLHEQSGRGTIGKEQIVKGLDVVFGKNLNGQMFKAAMRWLRRNRMIRLEQYEIKPWDACGRGRARLYRFGPTHPEAEKPLGNRRS